MFPDTVSRVIMVVHVLGVWLKVNLYLYCEDPLNPKPLTVFD